MRDMDNLVSCPPSFGGAGSAGCRAVVLSVSLFNTGVFRRLSDEVGVTSSDFEGFLDLGQFLVGDH